MYRRSFKDYFGRDRKVLYMILGIVMISVLTLTVVYATLSTTLNINGTADISSASWDIHLGNVQLNSSSATTTAPTITNSTTATFSTTLSKPGDFYEFTIDVVNDGSIDAMIDGVTKTPTLTTAQAKYLNYIVEYQNGEPINNKQLVAKNSFVRLKVKLEFRKDISASDLPTTSETLNLSFTVNYIQSDGTGSDVKDNGVFKLNVVSGDLNTVGSEVAIGDEHFYIMKNDGEHITMLAKYNLHVGNTINMDGEGNTVINPLENPSGKQDSSAIGMQFDTDGNYKLPFVGITIFSSSKYWGSVNDGTYIYDSNSTLYNYVESYRTYLESQGAEIEEARLIRYEELESLGCSRSSWSCPSAPSWVYGTSYWSGAAFDVDLVIVVVSSGDLGNLPCDYDFLIGVRPVIVLKS